MLLLPVVAGGILLGHSTPQNGGNATGGFQPETDSSASARVRSVLAARVNERFPNEGGLVAALLLAERDGVDREVSDGFRKTGTSHLLAISGFHVGVIAGWVVLVLRLMRLSRHRAIAGAALVTWLYAALLGFPGSAVRAATIFGLLAAGRLLDRPVRALGAWGSALLLIALIRPAEILRVGTQLSFLGSLGLILWAGPWSDGLTRFTNRGLERMGVGTVPPLLRTVCQAMAASAAAQWATIPLAAWSFQQVALMGLPVTLLATPLISLALPGALLTLLADAIHLPGTVVLAGGVEAALSLLRLLIRWAAGPGPVLHLTPHTVAFAFLAGLAARLFARGRPALRSRGLVPAVVVSAALIASPVASSGWRSSTQIHFLDVGQGDAIALRTRGGSWVVIDTGPPPGDRLVQDLLRIGVSRIDLLVLSHPDLDHIGGAMELMSAIPVSAVLDPLSVRGGAYRELTGLAEEKRVDWRGGRAGDVFAIDELQLAVISPGATQGAHSVNDRSLVLLADIDGYRALFTGDISVEVENELMGRLSDVDLLKVGHHGSRTSTGAPFVERISPETAVIQVGRWNRFGHPDPGVVTRLQNAGADVLRTDRDGRVSLTVRGGRLVRVIRARGGD